jgi:hypothetical protein
VEIASASGQVIQQVSTPTRSFLPIVIERAETDRIPVATNSGLQVNAGQENLEIGYTALSFHDSTQIRFRCQLQGLDSSWGGSWHAAHCLLAVPPGKYVFRVTARSSDGMRSATLAKVYSTRLALRIAISLKD